MDCAALSWNVQASAPESRNLLERGVAGAPVLLTLVWTTLFDRFAPLDETALLTAYLNIIFPPQKETTGKSGRKPRSYTSITTFTGAGSASAARRSFSCASSTSRWRFHIAA